MPKQKGIILFTGSFDGITGYHANGKYLFKSRSSLNKERFYSDPAFTGSRKIAEQRKITAPLASRVYHLLPKKLKKQGMIGKMIAEADRLHSSGCSQIEILGSLYLKYYPLRNQ